MSKHTFFYLLFFVVLPAVSSACSGGNSSGKTPAGNAGIREPAGMPWQDNDRVAVAFLGRHTGFTELSSSEAFKRCREKYRFADELTAFAVETGGREVYLVVPRDPQATVTVSRYTFEMFLEGEEPGSGEILYKSGEGKPFLMKCNSSDAHPDTHITMVDNDGRILQYSPRLNLHDGSLEYPAVDGGVLDFTESAGQPEEDNTPQLFTEMEFEGIRAQVKDGKVWITFFGDDFPSSIQPEKHPYEVEQLNSVCKGVYMNNIGQDINPILCMLMEDGSVEILDLFIALRENDFRSSGRLTGFTDIVGFLAGSVVESTDGKIHHLRFEKEPDDWAGGHVTIYGIDKAGKYKEIELFHEFEGDWYHFRPTDYGPYQSVLTFSPDWKLKIMTGNYESYEKDIFMGRFRKIPSNTEDRTYWFEITMGFSRDFEDNIDSTYHRFEGTFSARYTEEDYQITLKSLSGDFVSLYRSDDKERTYGKNPYFEGGEGEEEQ